MFYKFNKESNEWYAGNEVHFPDGIKITLENKQSKDGWQWHDEPPQEFINWQNEQNTTT